MHIALFLPDLNGGGAERVMLTLAKYFASQGHQVNMVLARAEGPLLPLLAPTVRLVDLQCGMRNWGLMGLAVSATGRLTAYLRREKPDALLSTLTGANLVAVLAHKLAGRVGVGRLVLREAATLKNLKSHLRRWLMCWFYPIADAIVVLNDVMRQEMISVIGLPPEKLVCIPNPVDIDFIRSQARIDLDHPWFLPGSPPVIIGIGRLSPQKDFKTLINAFAELRLSGTDARLVILGDGPLRSELENLVRHLNLEKEIFFAGFDSNPYRWLSRSKLFVLSSLWEGSPNVVLEALALQKAVVITAYDDSVNKLSVNPLVNVVPNSNVHQMANSILKSLQTPLENSVDSQIPDYEGNIFQNYLELLHVALKACNEF